MRIQAQGHAKIVLPTVMLAATKLHAVRVLPDTHSMALNVSSSHVPVVSIMTTIQTSAKTAMLLVHYVPMKEWTIEKNEQILTLY